MRYRTDGRKNIKNLSVKNNKFYRGNRKKTQNRKKRDFVDIFKYFNVKVIQKCWKYFLKIENILKKKMNIFQKIGF